MRDVDLSRIVSHALRHEPWVYELELDAEGWAPVDQLLDSIAECLPDREPTRHDLERMIEHSEKVRHEIRGDCIRALYGHSVMTIQAPMPSKPPDLLFHGTSRDAVPVILREGLQPMRRKYVHMSADLDTALAVGLRKDSDPMLLEVHAAQAHSEGTSFYRGNSVVWLADSIPPHYIGIRSVAGGQT